MHATPEALFVETPTGWRMRPNAQAIIHEHRLSHRDIRIRTNSLGFRGPDLGPRHAPRILFLGDSITLADYVEEEETFVHLVANLSSAQGRPLETINGGVGAIGLENELAILVESGLRTEPDVVVVCFYLNDVQASPGVRIHPPPRFLGWSRLVQHATRAVATRRPATAETNDGISPALLDRWKEQTRGNFPPGQGDLYTNPEVFNAAIQTVFFDWGSAWSEGAWGRMEPVLTEFANLSKQKGFHLLLVAFPVRMQVVVGYDYDFPQQRLKEIAHRLGVPVLDLLPGLRSAFRSQSPQLFYDQCHHTPYAQRLIAERLCEFILNNLHVARQP